MILNLYPLSINSGRKEKRKENSTKQESHIGFGVKLLFVSLEHFNVNRVKVNQPITRAARGVTSQSELEV